MKRVDDRHYTEEELLMHLLGDEVPEMGEVIEAHILKCGQCRAVFQEFQEVRRSILAWQVPEPSEESWEARKLQMMNFLRLDSPRAGGAGALRVFSGFVQRAWSYALENPLPTLGYVVVAVAFASERTITVFRLDRILPATNEVLTILKQVL